MMEKPRTEWKRSNKKKGRLQRKRIKEHNCNLGGQGTQPTPYRIDKPKTRKEMVNL